jgi:hypothetical protein
MICQRRPASLAKNHRVTDVSKDAIFGDIGSLAVDEQMLPRRGDLRLRVRLKRIEVPDLSNLSVSTDAPRNWAW